MDKFLQATVKLEGAEDAPATAPVGILKKRTNPRPPRGALKKTILPVAPEPATPAGKTIAHYDATAAGTPSESSAKAALTFDSIFGELDTLTTKLDNNDELDESLGKLANKFKEGEAEADAGKPSESEQELSDWIAGGSIRSKWGTRFARAADGGKSDEYTGNREQKARFRREWAETQLKELRRVRERRSSYKKVDTRKGTYKPFSMLYKSQGGPEDPGALKAAKNIASRCIAMGGNWVRFNPMSRRCEFLDLEIGFEELFEESWSLYEERFDNGGGAQSIATASTEELVITRTQTRGPIL